MSLLLHPQHGVNPSMVICLYCKAPTGQIIFWGAQKKERAPEKVVTSFKLCQACQERTAGKSIFLVEAQGTPAYPTGNFCECPIEILKLEGDIREAVIKRGYALVPVFEFQQMLKERQR